MEEIKELIEKIQREGVKAAQEKAQKIEEETKKAAADIIQKAKHEADKIISEAKAECSQMHAITESGLKQSSRDLIISLKKEIITILDKIIAQEVRDLLTPEELSKIIHALIKQHTHKESQETELILSEQDSGKLKEGFLSKLKEELKNGLLLKPSEDIIGGFMISFDRGRSYFDFTDKALADYIGTYLKPQLAEILK